MDNILIVDASRLFLKQIKARFAPYHDELNLLTAGNFDEAAQLLGQEKIAFLITDLNISPQNGLDLLNHAHKNYKGIHCLLMHTKNRPDIMENLAKQDIGFLNKPFKIEKLVEIIFAELRPQVSQGFLKGISVTSFISLMEIEQMSCVCEVYATDNSKGFFYIYKGLIYDAEYRNQSGEEAAIDLLSLANANITIKKKLTRPVECRINKTILALSVEAMKRRDDKA